MAINFPLYCYQRLDKRTKLSDTIKMKGSEFIRKIRILAKKQGVRVKIEQRRGKGSHSTLFYGQRFTIIRNLKDELKTGTYKAMLKQLGIDEKELR